MIVVGVLSGTSVDGIDVAVVEIQEQSNQESFSSKLGSTDLSSFLSSRKITLRTIAFDTVEWNTEVQDQIFWMCNAQRSNHNAHTTAPTVRDVSNANFRLGECFAQAILDVLNKHKIDIKTVDLIGSHGQTIWHEVVDQIDSSPNQKKKKKVLSTLQIGEPSVIAARTGITTVADFRVADVAVGGNGAPLMATFDWMLMRPEKNTKRWFAVQNIGGIGNVTLLPPLDDNSDPLAFDTGPGNVLINMATMEFTNNQQLFDLDGKIASQGKVNQELLEHMLQHEYFTAVPPKTTGRELYTKELMLRWKQRGDDIERAKTGHVMKWEDYIATVTELTAVSIAQGYQWCPAKIGKVLVSGGGCRNRFLMERLKYQLHHLLKDDSIEVVDHETLQINSDAKEALLFALLAYFCVKGVKSNVPSCTGASTETMLGKICPGNNFMSFMKALTNDISK